MFQNLILQVIMDVFNWITKTILCRHKFERFCIEPLREINHQVVIFAKLDLLTFIIDRIHIRRMCAGGVR